MSDRFMNLVAGLSRAGAARGIGSACEPAQMRDRFVLYMLAYRSDDTGRCTVSATELESLTGIPSHEVRLCLRRLRQRGWLAACHNEGRANTYRLDRPALERDQFTARLRRAADVYLLVDYGLPTRAIRALQKVPLGDLNELGEAIRRYRASPAGERIGFHHFLNARNMGPQTAQMILLAFDAYAADSTAVAHLTTLIG